MPTKTKTKKATRTRMGRPPIKGSGAIRATIDPNVKARLNEAADQLQTPIGHVLERVLRHVDKNGGIPAAFAADLSSKG